MEKERSNLELWLIVEENFNRIYDGFKEQKGLCNVLYVLNSEGLLTWREMAILKKVIREYGKIRKFSIFGDPYYWDREARKPRRKFIQKQILKAIENDGTLQT